MEDLFCCCKESEDRANVSDNGENEEECSTEADSGPREWEVNEWCTELRENEIVLNEINLQKKNAMLDQMQQEVDLKRLKHEKEMFERGKGLTIIQKDLATKELEIEEKGLEIIVRINELEKKFQGLQFPRFQKRCFKLNISNEELDSNRNKTSIV